MLKAIFMRVLHLIVILSIAHFIFACNRNTTTEVKKELIVQNVQLEETQIDPVDPGPPPDALLLSNPLTLQEWFFKFCNTEKPEKTTVSYILQLAETDNKYVIYLINPKEYEKQSRDRLTTKGVAPPVQYCLLSKNEYKDLQGMQIVYKIKSQLKEYIETDKFKLSSLAKAKAITMRFDDGDSLKLK